MTALAFISRHAPTAEQVALAAEQGFTLHNVFFVVEVNMNVIPSCPHSVSVTEARAVARLHQQSADRRLAERQITIARALSWYVRRVEFLKQESSNATI